jgi:pimeloyl-ACP methyl ester carboxylesterase
MSRLFYYPPDEYNDHQVPGSATTDITKPALRPVSLTLSFTSNNRRYVVTKTIQLARPPVVLVHGINSDPSKWGTFIQTTINPNTGLISPTRGIRTPFMVVDHSDLLNGNGAVESASERLRQAIHATIDRVRHGNSLPSPVSGVAAFDDYVGLRLAAKRVDIVAWSYGGVITRW